MDCLHILGRDQTTHSLDGAESKDSPKLSNVPLLSNHGFIHALHIIGSFTPYFNDIIRTFPICAEFAFSQDLGILENFS